MDRNEWVILLILLSGALSAVAIIGLVRAIVTIFGVFNG